MSDLYTNMDRELKIQKYSNLNGYGAITQLCTERCVMFTVPEKHLQEMKKYCEEKFGSCEIVEEIGSTIMCKVI